MKYNTYNQWINYNHTIIKEYENDKSIFSIAVKDSIETKDFPTTGGTPSLSNYHGNRDATVIDRLRNTGIKIAGKANLHELCFGTTCNNAHTGAIQNPHNPKHIPGGSSGGVAVAIAAGQVRAGVGTDTGGSSRIPAAFCGIYGFRPTTGRYPSMGLIPISYTRDTAGPMANNLDDICYMDSIITNQKDIDTEVQAPPINSIRLGVPDEQSLGIMDDDVKTLYQNTLDKLSNAGVTLISISLSEIQSYEQQIAFPVVMYDLINDLSSWLSHNQCDITLEQLAKQIASSDVTAAFQFAMGDDAITQDLYDTCIQHTTPSMQVAYQKIIDDNQLHAIISPTVPILPPKRGEDETITVNGKTLPTFPTTIRNTNIASCLGVPSISMPMGFGRDNLPAGVMLDGLKNQDRELLVTAQMIDIIINT